MEILVTGGAGFIGSSLCSRLVSEGHCVTAIDNLNSYYDPRLKLERLAENGIFPSGEWPLTETTPLSGTYRAPVVVPDFPYGLEIKSQRTTGFRFIRMDITDLESLSSLFQNGNFECVVNLAAQAGVRHSIDNPFEYCNTNVSGFLNVLECCRRHATPHLVYASSSSIYGNNGKVPFSESEVNEVPESLYAATKRCDELLASTYSRLYDMSVTGLRFFTVYGPWGRPDMAPMLFSESILAGEPIKVFNNGDLARDFTYIDDIVEGIVRVACGKPRIGHRVYNIGRGQAENLLEFITLLERALGRESKKIMMPMQKGEVRITWADTTALQRDYGYSPSVSLSDGIVKFAEWVKGRHSV